MCDINTKTNLKSVTIYKVAFKLEDSNTYYSWFTGNPIVVGKVKKQTIERFAEINNKVTRKIRFYDENSSHYNENIIGKISGFKLLSDARILATDNKNRNVCILKIEIGGEIMKGTTKGISWYIKSTNTTYAGTEVISIEEIEIEK